MLDALTEAGLDPQSVEHLWTCYEKARAAEDKAGFNTGMLGLSQAQWGSLRTHSAIIVEMSLHEKLCSKWIYILELLSYLRLALSAT